jgi:peptide/nickel transport system substrate-binding protein
MRSRAFFAALGLVTLLGGGCRPPGARPDSGRPWVVATSVDFSGVNELVSGGVRFTHEIHDLLFLGLARELPDYAHHPPTLAPSLATSWELSEDRRVLTFHLRPDARWSDGEPITARDVLFTDRAQRSPEIAWQYADSKDGIESVEAVDAHTVRYVLRRAYPYALVDVNDGHILPEHAWGGRDFSTWRTSAEWFQSHLVASGPFRVARWEPGVELVLERNPGSIAADAAGPEQVVFRVVPDPAARIEQLLSGAFDFVDGLTPLEATRVAAHPELRVLSCAGREFDYIGWNEQRPPFDDPQVRKALTLAIDREQLVAALWKGWARVAAGPVPADAWARDPELTPWPYDPEAARRILAGRGFVDHDGDGVLDRNGRPLRFELSTNAGNRLRSDALVLIQDQLRRIGVDAVPRTLEIQALTDRNLSGDYDATLSGWSIDTTFDFRPYFHSQEQKDGWNFVHYANPEVDRLLDATRSVHAIADARPMFFRIQRILHAEQPYTFLWEQRRLAAIRADVRGVEITPLASLVSLPHWQRAPGG